MIDRMLTRPLPPGFVASLVAVVVGAAVLHVTHLSVWITGFFFAMAGIRLLALARPAALPGRLLLALLTFAGLGNVLLHYAGAIGKDFGVALLTAMLGLKLLELRTRRDAYITCLLGYFLIVTQFLYDQRLGPALYLFGVALTISAMLVRLNLSAPQAPLRDGLREALATLGQSLPLMIVLFVLFPRPHGPLWGFTVDGSTAVTGISGSLAPGEISQLSRSRAVAFRVVFESGEPPPPLQRYWRGPVMSDTDGLRWQADEPSGEQQPQFEKRGQPLAYQVTLEPHRQRWLFALDLPEAAPKGASMSGQFELAVAEPIKRRYSYRMVSWPEYRLPPLTDEERARNLYLPPRVSRRMIELAQSWQGGARHPAEVVGAALDYFRQQPFVYTLRPPRLGDNPADEFLFETRTGFCEHYATSFVLLMRAAGIPARVVAGYQGGEWNPTGKHLIVRQSDAHAWAEVWLTGRGWLRVDPTAAVAPERIESSIDIDVAGEGAPIQFTIAGDGWLGGMLLEARWLADAIDLNWHRWVVGFTQQRQKYLLRDLLGLESLRGYRLAAAAIVGAVLMLLIGLGLSQRRGRPRVDPVLKQWRRFCRRLAGAGIEVPASLGPRDLQQRAIERLPQQAGQIRRIVGLYIGLRYGRSPARDQLAQLRRAVRGFRP